MEGCRERFLVPELEVVCAGDCQQQPEMPRRGRPPARTAQLGDSLQQTEYMSWCSSRGGVINHCLCRRMEETGEETGEEADDPHTGEI